MGKTPKKATSGGDERNLYNWRLKATTAPPNPSETSLHKRQRESTISNRSKLSTLQKKVPHNPRKSFKKKIETSTKFELNRIAKLTTDSPDRAAGTSKKKKLIISESSEESNAAKMQPESEETDAKLNPTTQITPVEIDSSQDAEESDKKCDELATGKSVSASKALEEDLKTQEMNKEITTEKEEPKRQKKVNNSDKSQDVEDSEESNLNLQFEAEDNVENTSAETTNDADLKKQDDEKSSFEAEATKNDTQEKEDLQSESQTETESNSVDVLEFTTSEISETSETPSQSDVQKEKEEEKEKFEEGANKKAASFVSYDPSIMLKDVQIKLNDCLKENSKLYDTGNASHGTSNQPMKDMSFGKTLRSISGRRSLSRMRHVTLREHRYSPSDSMFVNTSSASLPPDETIDYKILRYSSNLSDTLSTTNGSPVDRKRKMDGDEWNSMKKQKVEAAENSLLHSPISLLKGLRKPIQVSTPVSELKFQSGKLELDENSKSANEGSKKWCVIM